jgi:poly(A) polymerase
MLELHTVTGGRTFGFVHYPSEVVDLATFQNIPAAFQGLPNIPDFDPAELTSTQMLNDSFERDLTINALYYDMDTGDIVDYHDGIYDLREGILDTMADPRICLENDSTIALRALRFKAKYNFDFSEPLEATMQERAAEFMASLDRDTLTFHLPKFFSEGYAASCFDVLLDYGALPALFPAVGDVWETEAYQQAVMRVLRSIDNRHDDLQGSDAAVMSFAAILAYATQYDEVDAALDAQAVKYAFSADEREAVRRQMIALLEVDLPAAA